MRVFVPVVVRGEEEKGVRLWEFGKEIYTTLLGIGTDEDYGDFTDVTEGRDFTVEADYKDVAGRKVVGCTLRIKPKQTPATENAAQLQKWLDEQPDVLTLNRKRDYDEIKGLLEKWLNPEAEEQQSPEAAPAVSSDWVNEKQVTEQDRAAFTLNTNPSDKFDELFNS